MVTHRGKDVRVIDFSLSDSDAFCILKSPAGTMGYIAPEQLAEGATADARADIYSLGMVVADMAEATRSRMLRRIASECAAADISHRPSSIMQVRAILSVERLPWRMAAWLLSVATVVLMVFIGLTLSHRRAAASNAVDQQAVGITDTASLGGDNQVLDRSQWP